MFHPVAPPRYLPDRPFPARAYVPGYAPDPDRPTARPAPAAAYAVEILDPAAPRGCDRYLFGIDLWNHGYYWESHEAWEGLWHAAGRSGAVGALLKGLIRLSAAGVKVRQGNPASVQNHGEAARAQLAAALQLGGQRVLGGFDLAALMALAERIARRSASWRGDPDRACEIVFDRALTLLP
jgi:hypothetical protein